MRLSLKGCDTQGDNFEEAFANITEENKRFKLKTCPSTDYGKSISQYILSEERSRLPAIHKKNSYDDRF